MDLFSKDSHSVDKSNIQKKRTDRTGRMQSSTSFNIQNQPNRTARLQHTLDPILEGLEHRNDLESQFNPLMASTYGWSPMDNPSGFSIQQTTLSHPPLQQGMVTTATELNQRNPYQGSLGSSSNRMKRKMPGNDDSAWTIPRQTPSLGNYKKGVFSPEMLDQLPMHSPQQNIWAYGPLKNSYLNLPAPSNPARISIPSVYDPMYQGMGLHPDPFLRVYDLKGMGNNIGRGNNNFTTATANTNNNFYNSGSRSSNNYTTEYNNQFPNTMSLPIQIPDSPTSNEVNYSYGPTSRPILPIYAEGMVGNTTKICKESDQENEADDDDIFLPDDLLDLDGFEYNNTNENTDESVC